MKAHILIVEHNTDLAAQAQKACGHFGYTTEVVADVTTAFEALANSRFDGVLGSLLCPTEKLKSFLRETPDAGGLLLAFWCKANDIPFTLVAPSSHLEEARKRNAYLKELEERKDVCCWNDAVEGQVPYGQHNMLMLWHSDSAKTTD